MYIYKNVTALLYALKLKNSHVLLNVLGTDTEGKFKKIPKDI